MLYNVKYIYKKKKNEKINPTKKPTQRKNIHWIIYQNQNIPKIFLQKEKVEEVLQIKHQHLDFDLI